MRGEGPSPNATPLNTPLSVHKQYSNHQGIAFLYYRTCIDSVAVGSDSQATGVTAVSMSCDLSPSPHINEVVTKAHRRAAPIHRSFVSRDVNFLLRA